LLLAGIKKTDYQFFQLKGLLYLSYQKHFELEISIFLSYL